MKFSSIYRAALHLISDRSGSCSEADYAERAPFIASAIVSEAAAVDREYRAAFSLPEGHYPSGTEIPMSASFPLSDRFATAASYFMAAMLVLDEDEERYETLYDLWTDALATIASEIPGVSGRTKDRYPTA